MFSQINLGIFGGDQRQVYMAEAFSKLGYRVYTYKTMDTVENENCIPLNNPKELFEKCQVLIGPIPLTKDLVSITASHTMDLNTSNISHMLNKSHILIGGILPASIVNACKEKGIPYFDLMTDERITILNAIATAEGSILEAIKGSEKNLHGSKALILGYGRCAKVLGLKLKGLDVDVIVAARSGDALAYAEAAGHKTIALKDMKSLLPSCDFIFNTIPAMVLDKECLSLTSPTVTIIDIASAPGGVDYEYAFKNNINAKLCLGLPGKVSPKSSADILVTKIDAFMKERSD
ncbi:MAG TPA: dipicolinate synthase subunit DpsA [Clostridiales bacterium]|nr:dipicolinate synthase subunit DpsA [Clostridiales bacterium]